MWLWLDFLVCGWMSKSVYGLILSLDVNFEFVYDRGGRWSEFEETESSAGPNNFEGKEAELLNDHCSVNGKFCYSFLCSLCSQKP